MQAIQMRTGLEELTILRQEQIFRKCWFQKMWIYGYRVSATYLKNKFSDAYKCFFQNVTIIFNSDLSGKVGGEEGNPLLIERER